MRAVLIKDGKGPIENLFIGEAEEPQVRHGEVKVKVHAFGLNRADLLQRVGSYPMPPGTTDILGLEFSGTIVQVSPDVSEWTPGTGVFGLAAGGAYAEYIVVPAAHLLRKPSHLSWAQAASIPEAFITAFQALKLVAELQPGDHVLIHAGASGVGIAAIQLARFFGAKTVTATASSKEKLDWLLSLPLGATHVANYKTENFAEIVKAATEGHGADVVIDVVGRSHWERNIDALAVDGRMTLLALMSGSEVPNVNLAKILLKRLRVQGSTLRTRSDAYKTELTKEFAKILGSLSASDGEGAIRTYIHKEYSWSDIQAATREMEANKNIGKLVAVVDG